MAPRMTALTTLVSGTGGNHTGQATYEQGLLLMSAHRGLPTIRLQQTPGAVLNKNSGNTDDPQDFPKLRKY